MEQNENLYGVGVYRHLDSVKQIEIVGIGNWLVTATSRSDAVSIVKALFDYDVIIPEDSIVNYGKVM